MQNKKIHVELSEVETQAQQLESFLLMLEQTLISDFYGGNQLLPAVSQMTNIAREITGKLADLTQATASKDEVSQA